MTCKPGELAIIIRPLPWDVSAMGMIVEVLNVAAGLAFEDGRHPAARIKAPRKIQGLSGPARVGWVKQSSLRPIRDPGDDARDQVLRPLPQPMEA